MISSCFSPEGSKPPSIDFTRFQSSPMSGGLNTTALFNRSVQISQFKNMALLSPFENTTTPRGPSAASGPSKQTR